MLGIEQSWAKVKRSIKELLGIQSNLEAKIKETTALVKVAMENKDEPTVIKLRQQRAKLFAMRPTAKDVSGKTKKYFSKWQKSAEPGTGLGAIVTITLGVAGIAAASFVAVKGMQLLKDFKRESSVIDKLKGKTLSLAEARGLIKTSKVFEAPKIGFKIGMGMGMLLPVLIIGGFFYFKRGVI